MFGRTPVQAAPSKLESVVVPLPLNLDNLEVVREEPEVPKPIAEETPNPQSFVLISFDPKEKKGGPSRRVFGQITNSPSRLVLTKPTAAAAATDFNEKRASLFNNQNQDVNRFSSLRA